MGVFSWQGIIAEAGVDYLGGTSDPIFFNAKIGFAEERIFPESPSFSVGMFNIGTRTNAVHSINNTNQDIVNFVFGKTLPGSLGGGKLYMGGFSGCRAMGKCRGGFMMGYQRSLMLAFDSEGYPYDKWALYADWASGKNRIGGGGIGVGYYFTPSVYIKTGPVWFNTTKYNGRWKWAFQFFCDIPLPVVFDFVRRDCPETYNPGEP